MDWNQITERPAPYIPEVSSPTDTSNFDVDDNDLRQCDTQPPQHNPAFSGLHLPFVGFSFTMGSRLSDLGKNVETSRRRDSQTSSSTSSSDAVDGLSKIAYERRINRLEDERKELIRKLSDSNMALQKIAHGSSISTKPVSDTDSKVKNESSAVEVKRLQDEVNRLNKKNSGK